MAAQLDGKVALVTGGASGIGSAHRAGLHGEGARLMIADLNEAGGRETVNLVVKGGGKALFTKADVTQGPVVQALVAKTVEAYGRLEMALFNNAGIRQPARTLTADCPDEHWHQVLAINLTGVWLCMKHEIQHTLSQGGGAIVNTASVAGLAGLCATPPPTWPASTAWWASPRPRLWSMPSGESA